MTARLTIAIPTFDRPAALRRTLAAVSPQLDARCTLLILDNASPQPVAPLAPPGARVVRHPANVGACANLLRCFELAETDHVWLLSDDDAPRPDAVATIFATLDAHPAAAFCSFVSMGRTRPACRTTRGLAELLAAEPDFALIMFMSSGVYRRAAVLPYLRIGYNYIVTLVPQVAMVLMAADGGATCVLSDRCIVDWDAPPAADRWSRLNAVLGMALLADLPFPIALRREVLRRVERTCGGLGQHTLQLHGNIGFAVDAAGARHLYDQIWARAYVASRTPANVARRCVGWWLLRFPRLGDAAVKLWRRVRGPTLPAMARESFLQRS